MKKSFIICSVFLVAVCITGCRHIEYVAVPTVHTVYRDSTVHDSVDHHHYHTEFLKGDTVHLHDSSVYHHYHYVHIHDSVRDTVPVIDTSAYASFRAQIAQQRTISRNRLWWSIATAAALFFLIALIIYRKLHKD